MIHGQLGRASAAPFSEQILLAFNGQVNIRQAYTWNRDLIINFLFSVVMSPAYSGAPLEDVEKLADICREIRELSAPAGMEYLPADPDLNPPQHILRDFNPKWNNQHRQRISKFKLRKHQHDPHALLEPD